MSNIKERRWSKAEIVSMLRDEYEVFRMCFEAGAFGLLGVPYREWVQWHVDPISDDIVMRYV